MNKTRAEIYREIIENMEKAGKKSRAIIENIRTWLDAAKGELTTAIKLRELVYPEDPLSIHILRNSIYHLQQAVEKTSKVLLISTVGEDPERTPRNMGHKIHRIFKTLANLTLKIVGHARKFQKMALEMKLEDCAELLVSDENMKRIQKSVERLQKSMEKYERKDSKLDEEEIEKHLKNVSVALEEAKQLRKQMEQILVGREEELKESLQERFNKAVYCVFRFVPQGDMKEAKVRTEIAAELGIDEILYKMEKAKAHVTAALLVLLALAFIERYVYTRYPDDNEFQEVIEGGIDHPLWKEFDVIRTAAEFAIKEVETSLDIFENIANTMLAIAGRENEKRA